MIVIIRFKPENDLQILAVYSCFLFTGSLADGGMSEVLKDYDSVVTTLKQKHKNIDPFLLLKSSMLMRKYPNESIQRFWLEFSFKHEENEDQEVGRLQNYLGKMIASHGHGHYEVVLQTDLETVVSIARQHDIEWLGGEVYPNA